MENGRTLTADAHQHRMLLLLPSYFPACRSRDHLTTQTLATLARLAHTCEGAANQPPPPSSRLPLGGRRWGRPVRGQHLTLYNLHNHLLQTLKLAKWLLCELTLSKFNFAR